MFTLELSSCPCLAIYQVVGEGTINAPMFALKGPTMVKGSYSPAFPLKHQQKVRFLLSEGGGWIVFRVLESNVSLEPTGPHFWALNCSVAGEAFGHLGPAFEDMYFN